MLVAHSQQQYNKWKGFLNGEIPIDDMYILAKNYWHEIHIAIGSATIKKLSDTEVFKLFAEKIQPPTK